MELLVAVTIISALVSLAFPAYVNIMQRSRAADCMGHLRGIGAALQLYLADNNNNMPTLMMARESTSDNVPVMDNTLSQYTDSPDAFHCPADTAQLFQTTGSSYIWNNLINGQNTANLDFMGIANQGSHIPIASDKQSFHTYGGVQVNILYVDGHAAKEIQFKTN